MFKRCLSIAIVITSCLCVLHTAEAKEIGVQLSDAEVETLCNEYYIASSLIYATRQVGYNLDEKKLIQELGKYAELADTDEEISVPEALQEILGCNEDVAMEITTLSDNLQSMQEE